MTEYNNPDLAEGRAVAFLGDGDGDDPDSGVLLKIAKRWCVLWDSDGRWHGLDPDRAMELIFICDDDHGGTRHERQRALWWELRKRLRGT